MTTNTSMCVFNKCTDDIARSVIFKKHLIDNVFWDDSKGVNLNLGYDKADDVNVFIPKDSNDMSKYVNPKQYNGSNGWTLKEGDFIVRGNVTEKQVSKLSELSSKYDNVFTITLVDDKDFGSSNMQHFEIRGK